MWITIPVQEMVKPCQQKTDENTCAGQFFASSTDVGSTLARPRRYFISQMYLRHIWVWCRIHPRHGLQDCSHPSKSRPCISCVAGFRRFQAGPGPSITCFVPLAGCTSVLSHVDTNLSTSVGRDPWNETPTKRLQTNFLYTDERGIKSLKQKCWLVVFLLFCNHTVFNSLLRSLVLVAYSCTWDTFTCMAGSKGQFSPTKHNRSFTKLPRWQRLFDLPFSRPVFPGFWGGDHITIAIICRSATAEHA